MATVTAKQLRNMQKARESLARKVAAAKDPFAELGEVGENHLYRYVSPDGELIWQAQAGMQNDLFRLTSADDEDSAEEVLLGGMRGPGKTDALIAWMAEPVDNGDYRGIILRFSAEALKETLDRAGAIYAKMGARAKNRPIEYHFPSGAIIYTGHLRDERSFEDYKGHEYHRIGIEEGTQIPYKELYLKLLGSNRSTVKGLKPRVLITSNPDGPGNAWIKKRFIDIYVRGAGKIAPKTVFLDPVEKRRRVFIPGRRDENRVLLDNDPNYYEHLRGLAPHLQKAWIEGDWDAPASQFFPEFRPHGPNLDEKGEMEPDHARHVIPAYKVEPWAHRWLAMDWGFSHHSAVYWGARPADRRVHVYREMVVRKMGADEIGAEIAKRSADELENLPSHHMTLYLSHDAFSTRDSNHTIAEQVQMGIESILGPESTFILAANEEEKELQRVNPELAYEKIMRRKMDVGPRLAITIRRCNPDRINGWSYCRTMLRWKVIKREAVPDMEYAASLADKEDGLLRVHMYLSLFKNKQPEVVPGTLIHDCCPVLIETIPRLCADPKKMEDVRKFDGDEETVGDDPADAWRFLYMAFRDFEIKVPMHVMIQEEVAKHLSPEETDINLKIQAMERARIKIEGTYKRDLTIPTLTRAATAGRG